MANSITSPVGAEQSKGLSDLADDLFHPLEAEGLRHRVLGRLFGTAPESVRLGRYHVLDAIGRGAMGTVYAAYDDKLDRKVAIKLLHASADDSETRERLLREARALGRLSHPNVVQVHDTGEWDDKVFVAMEFVPGTTLRAWLDAKARTPAEILARFCEAGEGLAAAHEAGVVHRDFKPENVLVGAEDGRVRVADFGLAFATLQETREAIAAISDTALEQRVLTRTGLVLGTPAYMAPEQLQGGRVDPRTDQFAFAVALHEALFGARPFGGDTLAALDESIAAGPGSPRATMRVTSCVRRALARALAYAPEDRFGSMRELLAALTRSRRRARTVPILSAVSTILVTLAGLAAVGSSRSRVPDTQPSALAAKLAITESVHARERDAEHLADARAQIEVDPTAAAMELAQIDSEGWTPDAAQLLAVARLRGVATRIVRFDHPIKPLDARAGWIRWEAEADTATPSRPWHALAHDAVAGTLVPAPRSGMWADSGGPVLSYYEQGRGLQAWPLDGTGVRNLSADGDFDEVLLAVDPRGEFAALHRDDVLTIYDVSSGTTAPYPGFADLDLATAALAPGGRELAHLSTDGRLVRHHLGTTERSIVRERLAPVLRYSADGRWLGGRSAEGRLVLLDRETGEFLDTHDEPISTFAFSPSGEGLVTCPASTVAAASAATVWGLPTLDLVGTIRGDARPGCHIDFSADGNVVVVAAPGHDVAVLGLHSGRSFSPRGGPRLVTATVSADGKTMTTLHDGEARVWGIDDVATAAPSPDESWSEDLSYANRTLLVAHEKGVRSWDRDTGRITNVIETGDEPVRPRGPSRGPRATAAAMSSDGPLWASTLSEEGAWIVHADGQEEVVIAEHPLEDIVLAAKGAIVFAAARDGELWIHDLETGKQRPTREECRPPRRDDGGGSRELLAARDGSRVATTSDGILCVWDAASGSILVRREEPDGVWRLSPDLRLGVHSPRDRDDSDRLFELDRGTATSLPPEAYAIAVTAKGLVVYAHDALLWAWDAKTNERWAVSLAASVLRFATVSLEDDELVLHSARGGLRFVSLERPSAIGPAEAAALTEVVTLSPTKL